MKTVVVGAAGFIGSHVVDRLLADGHEVWGFDDLSTGKHEKLYKKHPQYHPSRVDGRQVGLAGSKVNAVFNCAAQPRMQHVKENPESTLDANVKLVAHLTKQCKAYKKPLIHCSSSSVYGHSHNMLGDPEDDYDISWSENGIPEYAPLTPANSYGFQKALAESIIWDIQPNTVMLRFFNVYGEGQPDDSPYTGVITKFLKQKREGQTLTMYGDGNQERDFTYIEDVVDAMIKAYEFIKNTEGVYTFNIGSGNPVSINDIAEAVGGDKEYLEARKGDVSRTCSNSEKARTVLNWEPKGNVLEWIEKQV